jgi:DNA repair protein NreA
MNVSCIKCKGRGFCGKISCPHIINSQARFKVKGDLVAKDFSGSSPTSFVGRIGYPKLNVGLLSPTSIKEDAWEYDAPRHWAKSGFEIPKIVNYRSSLVNSRFQVHAQDSNKMLDIAQEVGMASKPVDLEINLEDKPQFRLNSDSITAPTGPNASLLKAKITSNSKIHTKVDKVVSDFDLKSNDAMKYLYSKGFDENFLSKILSIGTLGVKKNRHLVPTRWGITAVDDTLGKNLIKGIRDFQQTDYLAYFGGYLGNYYLILTFPSAWGYELFEMYTPKASWNTSNEVQYSTDYEDCYGRKSYADETAGGYYACRLGILEKLKSIRRQGNVLALRFITGEYSVPLGVWVCREASRKSLSTMPLNFGSEELMLDYAKKLAMKKFGVDLDKVLNKSIMLNKLKTQVSLRNFF